VRADQTACPMMRQGVPFCGLPFVSLDQVPGTAGAVVMGAGLSLGAPHSGTENAPFFLRTLSKAHTWSAKHPAVIDLANSRILLSDVFDIGDVLIDDEDLAGALGLVERAVAALPDDVAPCVIGGDHTVTLAVARALLARRTDPFWVVQLDHHLDLQLWGDDPDRPDGREAIFHTNVMSHVSDLLGPGRLLQLGVNPFATAEATSIESALAYLRRVGRQVSVTDPRLTDETALSALAGQGRDVYLTVDIDVLDAQSMSSTGYPAEVGLSVPHLLRLVDVVLAGNRLIGCDVVEFRADAADRSPKTLADGGRAVTILLHLLRYLRAGAA